MTRATLPAACLLAALACAPRSEAPAAATGSTDQRQLVMDVAPSRVACTGVGPMRCLRVRIAPDTAWTLFYDAIGGFAYEEGFRWRIEVERRTVAEPPADGSRYAYRLLRVLERTAARAP